MNSSAGNSHNCQTGRHSAADDSYKCSTREHSAADHPYKRPEREHSAADDSYKCPARKYFTTDNFCDCPSDGLCTAYSSATGIRSALSRGDSVQSLMPPRAWRLLDHEMNLHRFLVPSDLDLPLQLTLYEKRFSLTDYVDVSEDLANRIENLLPKYLGFDQFTDLLKTRQIAYTRVRRALLHILLGLQKSTSHTFFPASYARVLGFRKSASPLLHEIKEKGSIPLITKLPPESYSQPTRDIKSENASGINVQKITQNAPPCHLDSLEEDLRAAQLWEIIASHKTGAPARNERQRHILIGEDEPD